MSKVRESKWERKVNDDSPNLECEVCWAKEPETTIYLYHGASYCADDLERAKEEGWHNA